jgi:exodeoxyribonuclease V gamma subunit
MATSAPRSRVPGVPLHLHRAWRTDLLADGLGELLAHPAGDPFEREFVVVPARGVERWLTQRLSHRLGTGRSGPGEFGGDGVCAGIRFLSPSSLIALLLDRERDDPWAPDRLVWPLLRAIDASLDEPWAATLARHLGHHDTGEDAELRHGRRYSLARRLATLFASYAVQRPALVAAWSGPDREGPDREGPDGDGPDREGPDRAGPDTDGLGSPLAADLTWQPELWRRLVAEVAAPAPDQRLAETLDRLRAGDPRLDLPARLSLFGHTRIPASEAQLLAAVAERRDVHLWLPQASLTAWDAVAPLAAHGVVRRADDASVEAIEHPLLASLGRDARELQRIVGPLVDVDDPIGPAAPGRASVLGWLQADLRANTRPDASTRLARIVQPADRSLQVHACHGPSRQIDVLREVLVGLLEDDPTLEPRDIVVMCPDIETFAPLIQAGFGLGDVVADEAGGGHPAHQLRVSLADRSLASTNPLLAVATALVELAGGRVTATEVLDLLAAEPVRRRFALDDRDLERVTGWVRAAGVRWGLDAAHRAPFAMQHFGHNTWRAGLDRILVGVAMSADEFGHLGAALPLDDVASSDIELVGRLGEFLDRLEHCVTRLDAASRLDSWLDALVDAVRSLADVPPQDAWQVSQFEREFARAAAAAQPSSGNVSGGPGRAETALRLPDVRAVLRALVVARPTRANFRTGTLSVCTLVPMRSVPHRVVCLVGLDDGLFPRVSTIDGDDVLARAPVTGERDPRSEDRQLLLDAVMAAGDTLVVCYTGADEHTGAPRPPAVPLDELIDAAARTAGTDPARTRQQILTRHPLQPYDARNLRVGGLIVAPEPFSFDRTAEAGARAGAGPRHPPPAFLPGPLPAAVDDQPGAGDLNLADLKDFFTHPARHFLRNRLQVGVPLEHDEVLTAIPIELDALQKWGVGDRLLREVLAGHDPVGLMTAEHLRGTLPPGQLGEADFHKITTQVQGLMTQTAPLRAGTARVLDVAVALGDGRMLTGTVGGVFGTRIVSVGYSSLRARQRLLSWLDLLVLTVARPDEAWTAHAVGNARAGPTRALAGPLDERARDWLTDLVALYDAGQCAPLAAPLKTACGWAEGHVQEQMGSDRTAVDVACAAWVTDPNSALGIPGEDADAWHRRAFGDSASLDVLLEAGLAEVAWRIWGPLLSGAEKVGPL